MESAGIIMVLIPVLLILILLTIVALLWHSGYFLPVDVKTCKPPFDELEVAYKFVRGSHKDCSMLYAEAHGLAPQLRCIGVYYDNPREVGENHMRSIVGLIINDEDKPVEERERQNFLAKGFQVAKFPSVDHVVYADFPHMSFLSVLIAVHRVVPSFRTYIQEKKLQAYPLIEICDGSKIVYVAPLSNQSEFFVYEALAESEEEVTSENTVDKADDGSIKDLEDLPDTISSVDSLVGGSKVEELPTNEEILDSLDEKNKIAGNGSEASTESFEELQLDS
ncbi:testis-expressed protein 264 homolog [Uloborus diversus]|uniref:testis-expressed protein 264 homolog n=1 Tax=Uloborus diversus TaxID=327109 RepID=UPI0024090CCD|nr:testis-expressed protein 264 homolog [Uloborus diversus]